MQIIFFTVPTKDLVLMHWANKLPAFWAPVATTRLCLSLLERTGHVQTPFPRLLEAYGLDSPSKDQLLRNWIKDRGLCTIGIMHQVSRLHDDSLAEVHKESHSQRNYEWGTEIDSF